MTRSIGTLAIALTLAIGVSIPTTSKAQALVELALIVMLVYGNAGDSGNVVVVLDHAGVIDPDQPSCSFTGSAEIDVTRVDNGNVASQEAFDIDLSAAFPVHIDGYLFPTASVGNALAAIVRVSGFLPANCGAVVHLSVSDPSGLTTGIMPPVALKPGTHTITQDMSAIEPAPAGGNQVIVPLGAGQELNAGLVGVPRNSVGRGGRDDECRTEGKIDVTSLGGADTLVIPFDADPVAIVPDLTNATGTPVPPGETAYYEIKFTNVGPSRISGSQPVCGALAVTLGVADQDANWDVGAGNFQVIELDCGPGGDCIPPE